MHTESSNGPIVVMGASGRVGREVVTYLLRQTSHNIIAASRSEVVVHEALDGRDALRLTGLALDANDHGALTRLFRTAALVIACVGPSGLLGDRLARACIEVDTPFIDAGGYDPLLYELNLLQRRQAVNAPLIISAGLMPGLTGLFTKFVIESTCEGRTPSRVETYCVARDAWTYNSAWDIVHSLGDFGQNRGFSVIRYGEHQRVSIFRAMRRVCFPEKIGRVSAMLMPSEELARLANQLSIPEARAYGSNIGTRAAVACMRARLFGECRTSDKIHRAALRLVKAAARDLRNLPPVFGLKVDVTYLKDCTETATVVIADTYQATGAILALAARSLLEGPPIASGVQMLHEAVDSRKFVQMLDNEGLLDIHGVPLDMRPNRRGGL